MFSSPFLLGQRGRFHAALNRFDPLREEPLHRLIDPIPHARPLQPGEGQIPWLRLLILWSGITTPTVVLAAIPSKLCGGTLFKGPYPMAGDMAIWSLYLLWGVWLLWMVHARRLIGDLVNHLSESGTVKLSRPLAPATDCRGLALRVLEWTFRLTPGRLLFWIPVLILLNVNNQYQALGSGLAGWVSTNADPDTLLFAFRRSGFAIAQQPNLAGTWHLSIASPVGGYFILVSIRLFVVFACVSQALARQKSLRIVASHPDATGGLLAIGQTALVLSTIIFATGVWLMILTLSIVLMVNASQSNALGLFDLSKSFMFFLLWVAYLIVAPLVFFLSLVPLRGAMVRAKREYLATAEQRYRRADERYRDQVDGGIAAVEALREQNQLSEVMGRASAMAVWPFDRATFRRFVGLLVSPLLPFVIERAQALLPKLSELLRRTW